MLNPLPIPRLRYIALDLIMTVMANNCFSVTSFNPRQNPVGDIDSLFFKAKTCPQRVLLRVVVFFDDDGIMRHLIICSASVEYDDETLPAVFSYLYKQKKPALNAGSII
jgi:hypothetical protein